MTSYCIKKNDGSEMYPWLCKAAGKFFYASLEQILVGNICLERFVTSEDASEFIKKHTECCDEQCLVSEIRIEGDKIEIKTLEQIESELKREECVKERMLSYNDK